ncbi:MAG: hypothetical protein OEZ01_04340 [Candidatus Heimdallarchaeota archaeon]|nr:hypothetical protein [Candidatus Heimdallarchaeota archaeon]
MITLLKIAREWELINPLNNLKKNAPELYQELAFAFPRLGLVDAKSLEDNHPYGEDIYLSVEEAEKLINYYNDITKDTDKDTTIKLAVISMDTFPCPICLANTLKNDDTNS